MASCITGVVGKNGENRSTTGTPLDHKIYAFRVLKGRFHAMSVANNHSGDFGRDAFLETLDHLRTAAIAAFGGGSNLTEAHKPYWIEKHGIRIAILGYDEFKPRSIEAGATWVGVAWSEENHVVADIRAARADGADMVLGKRGVQSWKTVAVRMDADCTPTPDAATPTACGERSAHIKLRGAEIANAPFLLALAGALRCCASLVWPATLRSPRLALHPASTAKTAHPLFPHP